ncbi:hypothetical protein [Streptomyces gobiensis]|uniref:hypothetical protein n=1 Tax=Streptomyces gobiensis TaxID=2875706 RepID=UPI001E52E705|nr:hypothetical protein [Streptomyces gobiensis]UGY93910.1 hypothetical protein test1122_20775 [Streptomyces gobiensis]
MVHAVFQVSAPEGTNIGWEDLRGVGIFLGLVLLLNVWAAWEKFRTRRRIPREQRVIELRSELSTGIPDARGHVRVDPGMYPGISDEQAESIARQKGFLRQTHNTKGKWLFYRMGTQPGSATDTDVRGGPPLEELQSSPAAHRTARWVCENEGFDPLDEATVKNAEEGMRKLRSRSDRAVMGICVSFLAGGFVTIAIISGWVKGWMLAGFVGDDRPVAVGIHISAVAMLSLSVYFIKRVRKLRKEIRELYAPVIASYREVVLAQENERRNQQRPNR